VQHFSRIIWIVLDSVGIGELPDAAEYGDAGRNTLGHVARYRPLVLPNLVRLGLANIAPLAHLEPVPLPAASFGKGATHSPGKDTTTGHWEMAGIWLDRAFPVYKQGFPRELMEQFESAIGCKTLGNKPASGTEVLKELGAEHMRTGLPIVYTSGDSVFQIAAHEQIVPLPELYRMCQIARTLLDGPHRVGRVIARPFMGTPGNFRRTAGRHDYAVEPPKPMMLDVLADLRVPVFGIGKIHDIYNGRGVKNYVATKNNADGMDQLRAGVAQYPTGLIFANLVDFDMLYGHRKDLEGFARSLEEFDAMLGPFLAALSPADLLLITADHGCDPDPEWPTTDHSREYVPILAYAPGAHTPTARTLAAHTPSAPAAVARTLGGPEGASLGVRKTLADMGQTVTQNFGGTIPHGESFLEQVAVVLQQH
jgi:phosphopentomutase